MFLLEWATYIHDEFNGQKNSQELLFCLALVNVAVLVTIFATRRMSVHVKKWTTLLVVVYALLFAVIAMRSCDNYKTVCLAALTASVINFSLLSL